MIRSAVSFLGVVVALVSVLWGEIAWSAAMEAPVFDMSAAVSRALRDNPSAGAAQASRQGAEEGRKAALAAFGPRLSTSYDYAWNRRDRETGASFQGMEAASSSSPDYGTYTFSLEVSQPVFKGFQLLASYQKAALETEYQQASLRQTQLNIIQQVQTAFLAYLKASRNVASERDAVARLREQLKITRAFYEVGLRPRLDVLQAEVDVSEAENLLVQTENTRDTQAALLNTLLGMPAKASVVYVGELKEVPFRRSLEACLETAYRQRPDLSMAARAVAIAQKERMQVQSAYYPQMDAYYGITSSGNTPDLQRAGPHGSRSTQWEVGVRATWNVFQWGNTYFSDQQAGYTVTRVRHEEESARLTAGYEVKTSLQKLHEARKRIALAHTTVRQAREAYEAAVARYQNQVGTNFDVLDASSKLTAAEASLTGACADYLTALSQLYVAMGEEHPDLMQVEK